MYYIKGFIFANNEKGIIKDGILVKDWEEAHSFMAFLGVEHYLITLIQKEDN